MKHIYISSTFVRYNKLKLTVSAAAFFLMLILMPCAVHAGTGLKLLLTSNLTGGLIQTSEEQDSTDPLLLTAQTIISEKNSGGYDLYLDLGNSFYHGALSRFSFGAIMIDFFNYFGCTATLVSSEDISMGIKNLEFLSRRGSTRLLSSNLLRETEPVFTPYVTYVKNGKKIAVIGITSPEILPDIADIKVMNISLSDYLNQVGRVSADLKKNGYDYIIVLSGMGSRGNLELIQKISEIDIVIGGGDSSGEVYSVRSQRIDTVQGKSLFTLLRSDGCYMLDLDLESGISIKGWNFIQPGLQKISDRGYVEYSRRLGLWKSKFANEQNTAVASDINGSVSISDEKVASMLRDRCRCEIGIVEQNSVYTKSFSGSITAGDITSLVRNQYQVYIYDLRGEDLKTIIGSPGNFVITGIRDGDVLKIQKRAIVPNRKYSVCSTQYTHDRIESMTGKRIAYTNTWKNLTDEITEDLKHNRSVLRDDYEYLDDRFRLMFDFKLSNMFDRSIIIKDNDMDTPAGQSSLSYKNWGFEDTANITLYNRYHQLVLTPYLYFSKYNETYNQNLLRGSLVYNYNLNDYITPYEKTQADTVLVNVTGRPVLVRETAGITINSANVTGKIGIGFEDQVKHPDEPVLYGFETIINAEYQFGYPVKYLFKLDSFISSELKETEIPQSRIEITNGLSFSLNNNLALGIKYRWYHFYSSKLKKSYTDSQVLVSFDVNANFKFF